MQYFFYRDVGKSLLRGNGRGWMWWSSFLWYYTRGQVAEMYAAYVWTSQNGFEEVKQWTDLCNPQIHPENKTVTENYRSDINERTFKTYKWNDGNKLELISTRKEKLINE